MMAERTTANLVTSTIAEQAYHCILERISTGVYRSGYVLKEQELSEELGISRTPIREALQHLVQYGLVEEFGRSLRVRILGPDDVFHLYQVRRLLELEAVRLAFGRLTEEDFERLDACDPGEISDTPEFVQACQQFDLELHRTISERSGNPLLAFKIRKLHDRVQLVCRPTTQRLVEHREIIAALKGDDCQAAVQAMANHIDSALRSQMASAIQDMPPESFGANRARTRTRSSL
ncbi:MAG: GntR family transcriptional regulator [Planctomycetota bacterium]|jgi:DNA-binding GntR family transcriptional regulator